MRRLFLVGPYPPPWGGIAVHVQALERLARERGIEVSVIDTGAGCNGGGGVVQGRGASGLARAVKWTHGSPLHVHIPGNNLKSWLVALALGRPFRRKGPGAVLTVHSGLTPAVLEDRANREVARAASIGYETVFCTNQSIASALADCGVSSSRLEVLPPFLGDRFRPGELPSEVAGLRRTCRTLVVAAVAEGPQYGVEVLVAALEELSADPCIGALIFGPGSERLVGASWIERFRMEGRIALLGSVSHAAALGLISQADVFVRPTLADGDSLSVREALSLGVRVVASAVGNRPREATLFRAGDPADLVRAIEASLAGPNPSPGTGAVDSSSRFLGAWEAIGLSMDGGVA